MTPADLARDNAVHFEGVKHAYRQTKDGVVISFVVHPHDVPKGLAEAPLGSRYIVALVQVGDDEQPIHQPAKEIKSVSEKEPAAPQPPPAAAKRMDWPGWRQEQERRRWRNMLPTEQSGIRCNDAVFAAFLLEEYGFDTNGAEQAAIVVRQLCKVESRKEFNTDPLAKARWQGLDDQFQAWQRVGA